MNTKDLKCFEIVFEEKSINTAAKKLFISPQGLGKIIQKIEDECKTSFFIRTKNGLIPTESGRLFYERSREISSRLHQIQEEIIHLDNNSKKIRIGFANGVFRAIPIHVISEYMNRHTEINEQWCEYENDEVIKMIYESELEYGFVVGNPKSSDISATLLLRKPVAFYVYDGHPLCNKDSVTLEELKNEEIITMNEKYHIYHDFIGACKAHGFEPKIKAKTMDGHTMFKMVSEKIGIAFSPVCAAFDEPNVKKINFEGDYTWNIYGIYRKDHPEKELIESANSYFLNNPYFK